MLSIQRNAELLAVRLTPFKERLGKMALVCSVGMVVIGFPMQIYGNWQTQQCGMHIALIGFPLLLYLVRIPYQISIRGWYLLPADFLGLLC